MGVVIRASQLRAGDTVVRPDGDRMTVLEVTERDSFTREAILQDKNGDLSRLRAIPERRVEVDRGSWVI